MGVTSGKAVRLGTSALSLLNMIQKVFAFALLGSVAYSVPVAEPDAKADPLLPLITTYGAPLVYHAPNCTTEDEVIQIKKCAPKTENECEDIEVPSQKLEYTLKCQNVTRTHCSNGITTINADKSALNPSGIRLGTPAITTRGLVVSHMDQVVKFIHSAMELAIEIQQASGPKLVDFKKFLTDQKFVTKIENLQKEVEKFASKFRLPGHEDI